VELQRLHDAAKAHGSHYYWKALQADRNDHLLATMLQHPERIVSTVVFDLLPPGWRGGDVPANETAYASRTAGHALNICGAWLPDENTGAAPRETD
jgi:hypothetical protein